MENLLFLSQRIPFPPDKGDKIRSWHILKHLRRTHRIFLGCFIDDPDDYRHLAALREVCTELACFPISPQSRRLRSIFRARPGQPLTLDYFRDDRLTSWVADTVAEHAIRRVFAFSSSMAPYAAAIDGTRVLDMVDLDSGKWGEYATRRHWPLSLVFSREAHTLAAFERQAAVEFDQTLLVSDAEVEDFRLGGGDVARVGTMTNGVDLTYFNGRRFPCPYASGIVPIVFTGAMDYWPNVDAVTWFAHEVLPQLRAAGMAARFYIVGSRPTRAVRRLGRLPHVEVTGRVADTRPYLAHAFAAVAPLQVARGVQNKVLEAMAMRTPVIVSPDAARGIGARRDADLIVAHRPEEWVSRLLSLDEGERALLTAAGRKWVERHHVWERNLRELDEWFPPSDAPAITESAVFRREFSHAEQPS
jgi:sugar transferase (PEP-CTERM/EpsH1 system associated)